MAAEKTGRVKGQMWEEAEEGVVAWMESILESLFFSVSYRVSMEGGVNENTHHYVPSFWMGLFRLRLVRS